MADYLRGLAIIVNESEGRPGSERDVEALERTLQRLNVTVHIRKREVGACGAPLPLPELKSEEWRERFAHCDYVIIAHFSHGTTDERVRSDKTVLCIQKALLNPLFKVPELDGKLKWLIVQSCRGDCDFAEPARDVVVDKYFRKYFLIAFAAQEGGRSFRHSQRGSLFVQRLCEELQRSADRKGVLAILEDTCQAVRACLRQGSDTPHTSDGCRVTQEPTPKYNFAGDFFFKRGFVFDEEDEGDEGEHPETPQ